MFEHFLVPLVIPKAEQWTENTDFSSIKFAEEVRKRSTLRKVTEN